MINLGRCESCLDDPPCKCSKIWRLIQTISLVGAGSH
uniref:Uncharacterized protein n=1 Tax=Rhizophora mucronata TaxID=61149 RepID=A0A2P2P4R0_RHIMU